MTDATAADENAAAAQMKRKPRVFEYPPGYNGMGWRQIGKIPQIPRNGMYNGKAKLWGQDYQVCVPEPGAWGEAGCAILA
jgi:hypothetical protein